MSVMIPFTLKQVFSYPGLGSVLKFAQVDAEVRVEYVLPPTEGNLY